MSTVVEAWQLFIIACCCPSAGKQIALNVRIEGPVLTISLRCAACGAYEERSANRSENP